MSFVPTWWGGLDTTLLLPILYGVCHTKEGSGGGRIMPNSRAIVLKQCGQCRRAGRMKGRLIHAHTTRSKATYCKGQVVGRPSLAMPDTILVVPGLPKTCVQYICVCVCVYIYIIYIYTVLAGLRALLAGDSVSFCKKMSYAQLCLGLTRDKYVGIYI